MHRFPFGSPSTRRPPRTPGGPAALFVLGVHPSALHVGWTPPRGRRVVDEPVVFRDGAGQDELIARWHAEFFDDACGTVGRASGNGCSGRTVVDHVLAPLGVAPDAVWFTDCVPTSCVERGRGAMTDVYAPFASTVARLEPAELPARPTGGALVRRAVADEGADLLHQLADSATPTVVTLGQEAADVHAGITGAGRVLLDRGPSGGARRAISAAGRARKRIALTHPGNRSPAGARQHREWAS